MERVLSTSGSKCGLDSKPNNQNRSERAKEILSHTVEEAEILREQVVDRLKDELQKVWLLLHGSAPSTGNVDALLHTEILK
jgi:hypothetical protein